MPARYTHAARRGILRTGPPRAADGVLSPVVQAWGPRFAQPVLLTARRNQGDRTNPVCQPLMIEGNNVTSKGQLPPVRWTVA